MKDVSGGKNQILSFLRTNIMVTVDSGCQFGWWIYLPFWELMVPWWLVPPVYLAAIFVSSVLYVNCTSEKDLGTKGIMITGANMTTSLNIPEWKVWNIVWFYKILWTLKCESNIAQQSCIADAVSVGECSELKLICGWLRHVCIYWKSGSKQQFHR